jgi:hypothetical protein
MKTRPRRQDQDRIKIKTRPRQDNVKNKTRPKEGQDKTKTRPRQDQEKTKSREIKTIDQDNHHKKTTDKTRYLDRETETQTDTDAERHKILLPLLFLLSVYMSTCLFIGLSIYLSLCMSV